MILDMKTKAVRLYGKDDLRLEEFELPKMGDDEILAEIVTDSLCMSSYKAVKLGEEHKKVPNDVNKNPIIIGHEFCGKIIAVGEKWRKKYKKGQKFVIQPNLGLESGIAPGYSFKYIGGDATKVIIPNIVIENNSLLEYNGDTYFEGSLVEPLSCIIGAFKANFHTFGATNNQHQMGIKENGNIALLGATGPMGNLAIDYVLHSSRKPKLLVVTGRNQDKLESTRNLYSEKDAENEGISIKYVNTKNIKDQVGFLRSLTNNSEGYDDVFIFAPDKSLVNISSNILKYDGCVNFFAGPLDSDFSPEFNFYNVHYNSVHIVGTSGGNVENMKEAIKLIENKKVNVAKIVKHILGLNEVASITLNLPQYKDGKNLVYTHKSFKITEISNMENNSDNLFKGLSKLVKKHNGLWNVEAENYLLEFAPEI